MKRKVTRDQPTPESLCSSGGGALTDPRSIAIVPIAVLETYTIDQGSGLVFVSEQPSFVPVKILLAFVGASPQNIYSFVSAINIQMRLSVQYNT